MEINNNARGFSIDQEGFSFSPFGDPLGFTLGALYQTNYHNIAWYQPGGPGTVVSPQQADGTPFSAYPVPGQIFVEAGSALWRAGCGHGFDCFRIQRDFDTVTGLSAALILCPVCSYIINVLEPYESAYDTMRHPIIIG